MSRKAAVSRKAAASPTAPSWLPLAGLAVGVWALLPKVSGPALNTADRVEFADHVVPAIVLLAVSAAALAVSRRPKGPASFLFLAGLVVVLAGLWMTATHAPLVAQAARGDAPWDGTIYHSTPGLAVLGLGLLWSAAWWSGAAAEDKERAAR